MILDVQFNSATHSWPQMRDAVQAAEAARFGVAWVVDHMAGQVMSGTSMMECFTLAGALAASTSTIGIGTLVANVANRSLGILAVAAATGQEISGGRFWLGIGAGAPPGSPFGAEHAAVGIDLHPSLTARHQRVADFVLLANQMWATGVIRGVSGFPVPQSPIPVIVGVNGKRLALLAAQHTDGINVRWNHPDLESIIGAARQSREDSDKRTTPLIVTIWQPFEEALLDPDGRDRRHYEQLGVDRLIVVRFDRARIDQIRAR